MPVGVAKDSGPSVAVRLAGANGADYDYLVPEGPVPARGTVVRVPLGPREALGVVLGPGSDEVPLERLRPLAGLFDVPALPEITLAFTEWVADYVMAPRGHVLRMALSAPAALDPPVPVEGVRLAAGTGPESGPEPRWTAARRRVAALAADGQAWRPAELAREAGAGPGVVRGLVEAGLLERVALPPAPAFGRPEPDAARVDLSADQAAAAERLRGAVAEGGFSAVLLDGVTGSGKTEVYFEAVAAALRAGRQVLVLLPEIALSAQWLDRFRRRFGAPPAEWHSDLTQVRRRAVWRAVAEGEARVVVGARSALFLPFPELGLVVVDEEHEAAYKQEEGICYHARDMAVARAHLGGLPAVLVSATPSLETVVNAEAGRYGRLHLPDRHGGATLPAVAAVDLRRDRPPSRRFLGATLRTALAETLAAGDQSLLFLNRRGYAPLTLCRACGHRLACPNCTSWLVDHRLANRLTCHHCGFEARRPQACPACAAEGSFVPCGPGVERIAEEVADLMPGARLLVMASDLIHGPAQAAELVRRIQAREVDIVVGTQLVAKGHHFPGLTLVGVVDADLGLAGGDLRAAERTFQLLHQVAGRAGRADRPGRVLLQTYMPEHPVVAALVSGDRDGFLAAEAAERRGAGMPPFGRLAALIVSGPDADSVDGLSRALARAVPADDRLTVWGPAPAPLTVLRGRHRRRFLVRCPRGYPIQQALAAWTGRVKPTGRLRIQIDIDPYSFL